MTVHFTRWVRLAVVPAALILLSTHNSSAQTQIAAGDQAYEQQDTRELVALVDDAAELVRTKGAAAFADLRVSGSRWRQGDTYIFVLDPNGNTLVHPDPAREGKNELGLRDVNGKPIIRGLIDAATVAGKPEGWYHYQWPVPGGLLPRWKSTYVRLVETASGDRYIVASGMYNDRMERAFIVDAVKNAVSLIDKDGGRAFPLFHDPTGPFIAKDAYIFVIDTDGLDVVNPGFPSLEGRNLLNVKDTQGKQLIKEMLDVIRTTGSGWVDYMWPKPGESVSTQKSAYVSKATIGGKPVVVGCGVYLADAPRAVPAGGKMKASELMALVRDAAAVLEKRGEDAYPDFRGEGSRWFSDDTYVFTWSMDLIGTFNAGDPSLEGRNFRDVKDPLGRAYGRMALDAVSSPSGEGWIHYMFPVPGDIFPTWKSSFVKRVTFPSGQQYIVGSGIYNMQMEKAFIEDVVNRAAALIEERGRDAFGQLRDKTGPFVFMDTYVFVDSTDGVELVNPAQRSIEGTNIMDLKDVKGKALTREYINVALKDGSGWVEYEWYKPGHNTPAHKQAYVRKVQSGSDTYIVGSGLYVE